MHFLRPHLGFTRRDKQRNVDIGNIQNQNSIVDKIRNYQQNFLQYLNRMEINHLLKLSLQCQPHEKKGYRSPKKKMETAGSSDSEWAT
jgi:hypothetical protein